jgi:hypothetical protein
MSIEAMKQALEALQNAEARLTLLIERDQHKLLDVLARDAARAAIAKATGAAQPIQPESVS